MRRTGCKVVSCRTDALVLLVGVKPQAARAREELLDAVAAHASLKQVLRDEQLGVAKMSAQLTAVLPLVDSLQRRLDTEVVLNKELERRSVLPTERCCAHCLGFCPGLCVCCAKSKGVLVSTWLFTCNHTALRAPLAVRRQ